MRVTEWCTWLRAPNGSEMTPEQAASPEKKKERRRAEAKDVKKRAEEEEKFRRAVQMEKTKLAKLEPMLQGTDQAGIAFLKAKVVDGVRGGGVIVMTDTGLLYKAGAQPDWL